MRRLIPLVLAACSAGSPGPGVDVDRVMQYVTQLASAGPRPGDSPASHAALEMIEHELDRQRIGFEELAVGDVTVPAIDVLVFHRAARIAHTIDPDVLVRFGPPGKALLVMAHYDTVPASPGATDNGVAVGVALELCRVLHEHAPDQPVMIAFTANEEIGLVGARAIAERRDDIGFAIALDLLGGSGPLALNGASELIGAAELHWIADAADRAGVELTAPLPHRVVSRWWPQIERADHGPFTMRGIRAVHFYDRGQDGEWIDLAYHSPHDVASRVDRASVAEVARLLRALIAVAPPPHAGDGFWLPVAVDTVIPRWVVIALELVLIALALSLVRVPAVPGARRGAGLLAAIGCYGAAVAAAIAIERLAAGAHPAPWLHAPLRGVIGEALVVGGSLGLASRVVSRIAPWIGVRRYLALGVAVPLALGAALFAAGAAELAWIWLVPAAALALAPRLGRLAPLAIALAALPAALVLRPDQLREAAWNGFLPPALPLAAWVGLLGIPVVAGVAWWVRCRQRPPMLGTLVLALGSALAVAGGTIAVSFPRPTCNAPEFVQFHLSCETLHSWP